MRFYKTNRRDDEGDERSFDEISDSFWASGLARQWLMGEVEMRLSRVVMQFLLETFGGWENVAVEGGSELDALVDFIFAHRPAKETP